MKNSIVIYFSHKGSNLYLANRIADALMCDTEAIRPRIHVSILLLLGGALKMSVGIRALEHQLTEYDQVVLCGPIWMGQFIAPLRDFVRRYMADISLLHFATCCAGKDEIKNDKFGYATVFSKVKGLLGDKLGHCEAFPIPLVVPDDKREEDEVIMNTRLSDANFKGEIVERFDRFIEKISV